MKPVFGTNFDTVHRLACFKRDTQGDAGDFDRNSKSTLLDAVHRHCRKEARDELESWWAPDTAVLFDDGHVEFIVRTCPMGIKDETKHRIVRLSFQLCEPKEIAALIEREKKTLNYWYEEF